MGRLSEILQKAAVQAGIATEDAAKSLDQARRQGRSMVEALHEIAGMDEYRLSHALAEETGMAFTEPGSVNLDEPLHLRFPAKLALRYRLLPMASERQEVTVACYDPFNLEAMQAVGREVPKRVRWTVAPRDYILQSLRQGYGLGAENFEELLEGRVKEEEDVLKQEVSNLDDQDEEASVENFVKQVFREALRERSTDIHLEPLEEGLRIRYRVDGALQPVTVPPNMHVLKNSVVSRLKIMAHLDIAEKRLPQDGRINLELDGEPIDVRVASIPSINGESISLRLLTRQQFDFAKLGLDSTNEVKIRQLLKLPNGIILVTGPTGSGKSTTLYTFLRELNTTERRIVTIEDPVENKLEGVVQIAVKPEINLTFASGLRSILRGDPNVIMVGEMRDFETTETAIRGALTGHLVFSTLHTNDSVGGISRLLDMGVEPFLISSAVRAFLAQRLVKTLCPACAAPAELTADYLDSIGFPKAGRDQIKKPVGCRECRNSGFRGRMAVMEICFVTHQLQELINRRAPIAEIKNQAMNDGMISLRDDGWRKVVAGKTSVEEILMKTAREKNLD